MYFIEFFVAVLVVLALVASGLTIAIPVLGAAVFLIGIGILWRIQARNGAFIFSAVYAVPLLVFFVCR